ncbi:hypothetical protein ADL25_34130 [Streptomyces sp. NRRL F-5122]|uniref:hypothetical protein n=1 Tax=Streptomyces sp. NRRL F-5122 TaxID=1609098 RepID=UPI0007487372|nr:hypothetical protein [Streptomyces sp. NRRL F-5122]KUJ36164.1 hypothetical protein ADL25_34130 [Streptomyces sp. NRRL F-5122]
MESERWASITEFIEAYDSAQTPELKAKYLDDEGITHSQLAYWRLRLTRTRFPQPVPEDGPVGVAQQPPREAGTRTVSSRHVRRRNHRRPPRRDS